MVISSSTFGVTVEADEVEASDEVDAFFVGIEYDNVCASPNHFLSFDVVGLRFGVVNTVLVTVIVDVTTLELGKVFVSRGPGGESERSERSSRSS